MGDRIRVLLVDDDEAVSELTATYLQRVADAISPTVETNPETALERLADSTFDCIVSDYDMPQMNGLAFLDAVRDIDPDLPFVLFTGKGSEEIASEAISAGVTDYLQKETGTDQYAVLANRIENAVSQHRAEREAAEANEQVRRIFERITDAFFALDDDWQFRYVNEQAAELFGYPTDELVGEDIRERFPESENSAFRNAYAEAFETQEPTTIEATLAVDPDRWVEARAYPAEDGLSVYGRDVTERHQMAAELRDTKRKIEALYNVAARAVSCTTVAEIYNLAVEAAENILEFDLCTVDAIEGDELVSRAVSKVVSTDGYYETTSIDTENNLAARTARTGETTLVRDIQATAVVPAETEYRSALTVPLGEFAVFQAVSKQVGAFDGDDRELAELLATHLTEALRRIESEQELRAERDRFAALFENVPNAAVSSVHEADSPVVQSVNPAFEEVFGWDADAIVGERLDEFIVPDDRRSEATTLNNLTVQGYPITGAEVRRQTKDGLRDFLLHTGAVNDDDSDTEDVSVYTDITEQKERERELARQNERLDEFASVVSHDLRNPLNVAQGRFEMLADEVESPHLAPLGRSLTRMDSLVADMLSLTKGGEPIAETDSIRLSGVAADAWETVDTADANLRVCDDPTVLADTGRLRQLLENLFRNAVEHGSTSQQASPADAVEHGSASNRPVTEDRGDPSGSAAVVEVGALEDGGFYVADDGSGIPEDERDRVFDHGYTTATDGTGFGLAIVRDIAEAHGWTVEAEESESGGARFEIRT